VATEVDQGVGSNAGASSMTRLATFRAPASPYISLTVCCTAIRLLRDDCVAWLVGLLARFARCIRSSNLYCLPRRVIAIESGSSKRCILHCKQNLGREFAPKVSGKAEKVTPVVNDALADDADLTRQVLANSWGLVEAVPMDSLGLDETVRGFYPPFL